MRPQYCFSNWSIILTVSSFLNGIVELSSTDPPMPREKAVPIRRTVHQFQESPEKLHVPPIFFNLETADEVDNDDYDYDDNDTEDEEYGGDDNKKNNHYKIGERVHTYGSWRVEPNETDRKRSFSLAASYHRSDTSCDENELVILHHRISVYLHKSVLDDLDAEKKLGLFCEGQHLIVEPVDGPRLDYFSCRALFPWSLLRALKRDVGKGGLNLRIMGWDKEGFDVQASIHLNTDTLITSATMEWLLSSLFSKASVVESSSSSSSSADDVIPKDPTWFTPFSEDFCTETFLDSTSAFYTSPSSSGSVASSLHSQLSLELKNGGLTTALRSYQLDGVHWLFEQLCCSKSYSGRMYNFIESNEVTGRCDGWVPLPTLQNSGSWSMTTAVGSNDDISTKAVKINRLWYNMISQRLSICLPPRVESGRMMAVLADEMGIGKSIQVLSLVMLMKLRSGKKRGEEALLGSEMKNPIVPRGTKGAEVEDLPELGTEKGARAKRKKSLQISDRSTEGDSSTERKRKRVDLSQCPCLCGRRSEKNGDMGWVECGDCLRWLHVNCCGFSSAEEASREEHFKCLACSCVHHGSPVGQIASAATLILMPATLIAQWKNEVHKHFVGPLSPFDSLPLPPSYDNQATNSLGMEEITKEPPLNVFVYEGCDDLTLRRRGLTFSDVDPRNLASKYDIIFLSLKTLTKEFHQAQNMGSEEVSERPGRLRRFENYPSDKDEENPFKGKNWGSKMYISYPPPFMCIRWAMVVVDETQKIEGESTSQGLTLCMQLSAERRLCVTGTPLGSNRSSDLYSLCQFLHVDPYGNQGRREWLSVFGEKSLARNERMRNQWLVDLFAPMVLRRTKNSVAEQLGLDATVTTVRMIDFSGFEVGTIL